MQTTPGIGDLVVPGVLAPAGVGAPVLEETHISWVILVGDEVIKIKKPVDFGFVDFTTLALRKAACEAEVALNSRLAPDVYLGILPVRDSGGTWRVDRSGAGEGTIVDWAVHMRRLDSETRADHLLERGALSLADVDRVAERVASFHETLPPDRADRRFDEIRQTVAENFELILPLAGSLVSAAELKDIEGAQRQITEGATGQALLKRRLASGRVREGHGDLRLEHVYLRGPGVDGVTLIDCVEFSERIRVCDVAADIGFLAMDLESRGAVLEAERLLARYARDANDFDLYDLVDFYVGYRACVRGKINLLCMGDGSLSEAARSRAAEQARRYLLLALAASRPATEPRRLVAVGGIIASGKSSVSDALAASIGCPVVDADRTRKHLLDARPTDAFLEAPWQGAYAPGFSEQVYAEVLRRAERVLTSGRSVIVEASFRRPDWRANARGLAEKMGVPFTFVECQVPREVARERLEVRKGGVSDGRLEIFDDFCERYQAPTELPADLFVPLDTARPLQESVRDLERRLDIRPRRAGAGHASQAPPRP